jgi:hypothetical protein
LSEEELIFEWTSHPLRQRPGKAIVFWIVAGFVLGTVYAAFRSIGWVVMAALFLGVSLRRFLFPTRYRLTTSGIEVCTGIGKMARRWSDFKRADFEQNGVFLSPFAKRSRLENYRGLFLPFPTEKERLKGIVRERMEAVSLDESPQRDSGR